MNAIYIREPTEQQREHEPRWTGTTNRVLEQIRSAGTSDAESLSNDTGYSTGTISAQISILRRMGLVSTETAVETV